MTETTRVKLTKAEQADIRKTREKILRKAARVKEQLHILNVEMMKRIRGAHPETEGKYVRPEGEWLIIYEPDDTPRIILPNGNGRRIA
jgi:hypothetical protein